MGFEQKQVIHSANHTVLDTWVNTTVVSVGDSADELKVKNLMMRGLFWVDQGTEVNTQYGGVAVALYRISDQVGTPDMDIGSGGIDRMLRLQYVLSAGQNNPVLFTLQYRAVNVKPGIKLMLSTQAKLESSTDINHRVQIMGTYWSSDD